MDTFHYYSYLIAALAYLALIPLSAVNLKNRISFLFFISFTLSSAWAGYTAYTQLTDDLYSADALPLETLRNASWIAVLAYIAHKLQRQEGMSAFLKSFQTPSCGTASNRLVSSSTYCGRID